jgi:hypothetical protein
MTIAAIDTVVTRVVLVAELHGLLNFEIPPGQIRRPSKLRICIECHTG